MHPGSATVSGIICESFDRHGCEFEADFEEDLESPTVTSRPTSPASGKLQQHLDSKSCYPCPDCGKSFTTSSGLKQHQHVHSSVKPFQCEVCFKAYTQFSNLCRHKRMHADCRQQIKCRECGQAFSTIHSLNKHKRYCESISRSRFYRFNTMNNNRGLATRSSHPSGAQMNLPNSPLLLGSSHVSTGHAQTSLLHAAFPQISGSSPQLSNWYQSMIKAYTGEQKMESDGSEISPNYLISPDSTSSLHQVVTVSESEEENNNMADSTEDRLTSPLHDSAKQKRKEKSGGNKVKLGNQYIFRPFADSEEEDNDVAGERKTETKRESPLDLSIHEKVLCESGRISLSQISPASSSSSTQSVSIAPKPSFIEPVLKPSNVSSPKLAIIKPMTSRQPEKRQALASQSLHSTGSPRSSHPMDVLKSTGLGRGTSMNAGEDRHNFLDYLKTPGLSRQNDLLMLRQAQLAELETMAGWHVPEVNRNYLKQTSDMYNNYLARLKQVPVVNPVYGAFWGGAFSKHKYSCKFCGKVFPRSANLTRHLRTHTGEQPYKCKYCERSFSISSNLQRHIRNIHKKEKPYTCTLCGRCFGQQTNLDRHMRSHELQDVLAGDEHDSEDICRESSPEPEVCGEGSSSCMVFPDPSMCQKVIHEEDQMTDDGLMEDEIVD